MAEDEMARQWSVLENSPEVMNNLAYSLGVSQSPMFHEVYSLTDPDLLALIPRPVHALLCIIPLTDRWKARRESENEAMTEYEGSGPDEPVTWFKQTIPHACGTIGLLHCVCNGDAAKAIEKESGLGKLLEHSIPLRWRERARVLETSDALYEAHEAAAKLGESKQLNLGRSERVGQHFVAFVKGKDGHLWELEGTRGGPISRGKLEENEDMLSEKAVGLGLGRLIEMEQESGADLRFSCIALAPAST